MPSPYSNTTAPPDSESSLSAPEHARAKPLSAPRVPALAIIFSPDQPARLGEIAFLNGARDWWLGRELEGEGARICFGRQRPNEFHLTGPLEASQLSRRHLEFTVTPSSVHVKKVGQATMRINGARHDEAALIENDVITIGNFLSLLFTRRKLAMERRLVDPQTLRPFGEPDARGIIGESPAAWELREQLVFAAKSTGHVLVYGPSGTGKELAAHAIHALSGRTGEFVGRNATTLPATLIDAELFGCARNYPNAGMPEREGLVGAAEGGTLFFDEIADMPIELQAHLLRFMDADGEHHRLGDPRARRANVRVVAATNRPLGMVKNDLLARLTNQIRLPSLDERREDIPLIAQHLLAKKKETKRMTPELVTALVRHEYTTNVRELDLMLNRAIQQSRGDELGVPEELLGKRGEIDDLIAGYDREETPDPTAEEVRAALKRTGWKKEDAARLLGKSRHQLYRLI